MLNTAKKILETERLTLRELVESDDEFILDLLNQPSFIKYIGDRNIRDLKQSREFIESRFQASYENFGYGLWAVDLKTNETPIGICGFVKRDSLPDADLGFAFLPQFEKKGYAFESSSAAMKFGKEKLKLEKVLAITTQNNESSIKLLKKLGFVDKGLIKLPHDPAMLKLFSLEQAE